MKPSQFPQVCMLPSAIPDLFYEITTSRKITLAERYALMTALLQNSLSEDEERLLNRLFYALRRKWVEIV